MSVNHETDQARQPNALTVSVGNIICYEWNQATFSKARYTTPPSQDSLSHITHLESQVDQALNAFPNRWIETTLRLPFNQGLILEICKYWESDNPVYLRFKSKKNTIHQAMITGIRSDIDHDPFSNSIYRFLELRFHINSNFFK